MFRISCSSSLHNGCDEPEILRYENLKSVPQALTSDSVTEKGASPDTGVTQVYCAALPVAYSGIPSKDWESLATLILEAAYEATMLAAVLNAAAGTSNRLLLTRIGGGAFGNDDAWINTAILRALRIVSGQGLQVVMVSYGSPNSAMRSLEAAWQNEF